MRTPEQWLAYGDDLPLKLGEVLTPGPWKHDIMGIRLNTAGRAWCRKCKQWIQFECFKAVEPCSVPDKIKIDWNTAKYWQRKIDPSLKHFRDLYAVVFEYSEKSLIEVEQVVVWVAGLTKQEDAKIPLIAAAMAIEGKK